MPRSAAALLCVLCVFALCVLARIPLTPRKIGEKIVEKVDEMVEE